MRRGTLVPRNENHKTMTLLGMEREGKMRYRKNRRDACMSKPNNEPVIVEKPVAEMNAAELDSALALDVERLLRFGRKHKMIKDLDMLVARNTLLDLLGLSAPCEHKPPKENFDTPTVILEHMLDLAAAKGLFDNDVPQYRINFETRLMGAMMPRESEILRKFRKLYAKKGPQAATDWFYDLCVVSNYIRTAQIAKNIQWNTKTPYGELEITINLTKPEKDPKVIAMERLQPAASYPKCMLCKENIGYASTSLPVRPTAWCRCIWPGRICTCSTALTPNSMSTASSCTTSTSPWRWTAVRWPRSSISSASSPTIPAVPTPTCPSWAAAS